MDISPRRPRLDSAAVRELLERHYGLRGSVEVLPSDRDVNFAVRTDDGARFVFKIAHALEDRGVLAAQHAAIEHVAARGLKVPCPERTVDGRYVFEAEGADGDLHLARLLTYLPGTPLATAHPRSLPLLADVGRCVARLTEALADFEDPAFDRALIWDMARAEETVSNTLELLPDHEGRLVEPFVAAFHRAMDRYGDRLRRSVIHNDANDYNLLVNGPEHRDRRVIGLIDFGDMVSSFTVAELAVAAAYAVMDVEDPLRAASAVVQGYHDVSGLTEEEVAVLFPMMAMRLGVSVCLSARRRSMEPENEYLSISRAPALRVLASLSDVHPRLAEYLFRRDAGYEPCPRGADAAAWCSRASAAPIVRPAPGEVRVVVFDFSTTSADWSFEELTDPGRAAPGIDRRMERLQVSVGVGRYGEVRLIYRGEQFGGATQARTVHLGVDLFQHAGGTVAAPFDGTVHSVGDNDRPFDYGPTVLLEHRPAGGPVFHTLYGHLSRASTEALRVGDRIRAGQAFAEIGTQEENGGWAPHLHFQIIADLLGREGEFPGVAPPWMKDVWMAVSPDPSRLLDLPHAAVAPPDPVPAELLEARRRHVGPSLRVSYRTPLALQRGRLAYLYDHEGQAYLDAVNNVAHVGHCHPHVAEAVARQMRLLNTNTRYLYPQLARYAERLVARLPKPLTVCYFVNSGSEANDLALRMARAHTGASAIVAIDHAYHGHLSSLIDISPYKFDGEGGGGRPGHVRVVPIPDPYRRSPSATDYVPALRSAVDGADVAAFIAEPAMGCGGQVFFPQGFLTSAYSVVREAGGVCIADEVQTGLGRMGETFWAFELQDVIPDIVTMGKPLGNGHPLGAVVTTSEIAASFDTGMEYFNTFGGNPVSCAAGLAVLDVVEGDGLQEHARRVGIHFRRNLDALRAEHEIVGDVRGSGLFIGVELVRNRGSKMPAGEAAEYVVERMREEGILAGRDGPFKNVLKIKPPMAFGTPEADRYAATLDEIMREDFIRARCAANHPDSARDH